MLYYDRINISEGIMFYKTSESKECYFCYYWYFLNQGFRFQANVYNRYHGSLMVSMNLSDIAILNIKNADYCCIISKISKTEAIQLKKHSIIKHKIYYHI